MHARSTITVVGLGNIGSHAAQYAARLPFVGRLTLVDFDVVERRNLAGQAGREADLKRPKAVATAEAIRAARPDLETVVLTARLEDVPLAQLRSGVILGCLDSVLARMLLNERAVALGIPMIDAGVSASGSLARVGVFGRAAPCAECAWSTDAYASAGTLHGCDGTPATAPPTAAPAFLGAAAAALQVAACARILSGSNEAVGTETILDLENHKLVVSSIRPNPACRLAPHASMQIERLHRLPAAMRLESALRLGPGYTAGTGSSIRVARGPFAKRVRCQACGHARSILRLVSSLTRRDRRCRRCDGFMVFAGSDLAETLALDTLSRTDRNKSLGSVGVRFGDVITVQGEDAARHFELVAPADTEEEK